MGNEQSGEQDLHDLYSASSTENRPSRTRFVKDPSHISNLSTELQKQLQQELESEGKYKPSPESSVPSSNSDRNEIQIESLEDMVSSMTAVQKQPVFSYGEETHEGTIHQQHSAVTNGGGATTQHYDIYTPGATPGVSPHSVLNSQVNTSQLPHFGSIYSPEKVQHHV